MKRLLILSAVFVIVGLTLVAGWLALSPRDTCPSVHFGPPDTPPEPAIVPVPFHPAGSAVKGWKVVLHGGSLATPAVADGKVFLGGGLMSHYFFALDAATGAEVWHYQCADNGPTAAVVQDGYVVFCTESCELEVLMTAGVPVWKTWLGDPLTTIPALDQGRVYATYPEGSGGRHQLACFDVRTGEVRWKHPLAAEALTCPVVAEDRVHVATRGGTLCCFRQSEGLAAVGVPRACHLLAGRLAGPVLLQPGGGGPPGGCAGRGAGADPR
jgi:outer membrane protein assembly factor BamB